MRYTYRFEDVVNDDLPGTIHRTFQEWNKVLEVLRESELATVKHPKILDLGAGYGRMLPLLCEISDDVTAVEREPHFRTEIKKHYPGVKVHDWSEMDLLASQHFDLILSFTVMQHLKVRENIPTINAIKRLCAEGGLLLLVEETDHQRRNGSSLDENTHSCQPLSIDAYASLLRPDFRLLLTAPRKVTHNGVMTDSGHFMLFRKETGRAWPSAVE